MSLFKNTTEKSTRASLIVYWITVFTSAALNSVMEEDNWWQLPVIK